MSDNEDRYTQTLHKLDIVSGSLSLRLVVLSLTVLVCHLYWRDYRRNASTIVEDLGRFFLSDLQSIDFTA